MCNITGPATPLIYPAEMWHRTEKRALLGKSGLSDRLIDSIPGDSIHRGPIVLAISIRSIPYNLLLSH